VQSKRKLERIAQAKPGWISDEKYRVEPVRTWVLIHTQVYADLVRHTRRFVMIGEGVEVKPSTRFVKVGSVVVVEMTGMGEKAEVIEMVEITEAASQPVATQRMTGTLTYVRPALVAPAIMMAAAAVVL
jgi:hypothetical protein